MKITVFLFPMMVKIIFHFFRQLRVIALQERRNISTGFIFLQAIKLSTALFYIRVVAEIAREEKYFVAKKYVIHKPAKL